MAAAAAAAAAVAANARRRRLVYGRGAVADRAAAPQVAMQCFHLASADP